MSKLALIVLGWVVLGMNAQAASFDCGKASTKVEHLICDNPGISKLDDELAVSYKAALQDQAKSEKIRQTQKQWMKERNTCNDVACVKDAYVARLQDVASSSETASDQTANVNPNGDQHYHFQLTKGFATPVCVAYLKRLNTTQYKKPPYCDRPENDTIPDFARLNRVPLSPADVHDLYPILDTFFGMANNDKLDWSSMALQQDLIEHGQFRLTTEGIKGMQTYLDNGWTKIWRYDPLININNDGTPDHIQVWHGSPFDGVGGAQCGDDGYPVTHYGVRIHQPQVAFAVSATGDRLDVDMTEKVFAHPIGGYPLYIDKHWKMSTKYRPIGRSMGIFKYRDLYYFDTFFDGWGDFEGKRRTEGTRNKNQDIANTLAVFLHKDGKTKQVCEYLMTDNETQNEGSAK